MAKKICFPQFLRPKILKNKGPDVNFLFDFSKTILVLLESNKKCGLSHLFFEIGAAKVGFPSQNHTFFVDKMCFSQFLRPKIFKNKGPDVNFLFDFSKTMLVLLESNNKIALACYFFEISVAKVGILYYNDILKTQL